VTDQAVFAAAVAASVGALVAPGGVAVAGEMALAWAEICT